MSGDFRVVEATVDEIHDAMEAGELTSEGLVERYIERIEAYDKRGPALNSVVTINRGAPDRAAELDARLERDGFIGPLHGIPVLVKDQVETAGIRTTFGSEALTEYVPRTDATLVSRLKDAGAVVLVKTNLPDFATSYFGYSSVNGQTKNPYDPSRDPGGSSAGTGAGVAANLGTIGIGEDTGGSIRVPSANCNLFGIHVTTGLVSRVGLSPQVPSQDTAGPMARTMTDLAILLDVLVGYDPADSWSGVTVQTSADSYEAHLDESGLDGARIGVLREAFGSESNPRAAPVNDVVANVLEVMSRRGAELIDPVSISDMASRIEATDVYEYSPRACLDEFLREREEIRYDSVRGPGGVR